MITLSALAAGPVVVLDQKAETLVLEIVEIE